MLLTDDNLPGAGGELTHAVAAMIRRVRDRDRTQPMLMLHATEYDLWHDIRYITRPMLLQTTAATARSV